MREKFISATWVTAIITGVILAFTLPPVTIETIQDQVLVPAGFYSSVIFVCYYTTLSAWWRNPMGRMLAFLDLAIAVALLREVLAVEFGVSLLSSYLTRLGVVSLAVVPAVIISRTWLLGRLNGWRPHPPWEHQKRDAAESDDDRG